MCTLKQLSSVVFSSTRDEKEAQLLLDFEEDFHLNLIIKITVREKNNLGLCSYGEEVNNTSYHTVQSTSKTILLGSLTKELLKIEYQKIK